MMRWILPCAFALSAITVAPEASAQLVVVGPTISFPSPPRLVVVSPGVQVVHDHDHEIFFVGGYYWMRSGGVWYRTNHHRGRWVAVETAHVPRTLVRIKPGTYRRYKGEKLVVAKKHKHKRHKHKDKHRHKHEHHHH